MKLKDNLGVLVSRVPNRKVRKLRIYLLLNKFI